MSGLGCAIGRTMKAGIAGTLAISAIFEGSNALLGTSIDLQPSLGSLFTGDARRAGAPGVAREEAPERRLEVDARPEESVRALEDRGDRERPGDAGLHGPADRAAQAAHGSSSPASARSDGLEALL